jgi:hypothetical protein
MKILIVETESFGDGREPQIRPLIKYVYRLLNFNRRIKANFQEDKGDRPRVTAQNVTNIGRGEYVQHTVVCPMNCSGMTVRGSCIY